MIVIQDRPASAPTYKTLVMDDMSGVAKRYAGIVISTWFAHGTGQALTSLISGRLPNLDLGDNAKVFSFLAFNSALVALGSLPLNHLFQRPDLQRVAVLTKRMLGSSIFNVFLAFTSQIAVAHGYHQEVSKAAINGLTRGFTRGLPLSLNERDWGYDQNKATVVRQVTNFAMMLNATTVTGAASLPSVKAKLGSLATLLPPIEIGLLSLAFYLLLKTPLAESVIGPRAQLAESEKINKTILENNII